MLKGKLSKAAWLVVLIMMMIIIAACGSNNDEGGTNTSGQNETNNAVGSEEGTEEAVEETVDVKIMGQFSEASLSETDNLLVESIEEATNTNIEFEIPPSTGYNERLQLMLTTGEYPDLVYFSSPKNAAFLSAVKDGVIVPINSYLEGAENVMEYTYDISWDALKVNNDENIYALPRTSVIRSDAYFIRKDWLDNLGITLPEDNQLTLEEMTDILRKFTNEDPDGNNIDDTYGLGSYTSADKSLNPEFRNEFGNYGWQESDGGEYKYTSAEYDLNRDEYTNALEFTAELFKERLIDPDAPLLDGGKALERFKSGITGVFAGFAGNYQVTLNDGKEINPDFELDYVFVKNEQGEQKGLGQGTGLYGVWAITTAAENPQRIVDIFDYMLSDEGWDKVYYGIEGYDYTLENGERIFPEERVDTVIRSRIVRRANDFMFFVHPDTPEDLKETIVPHIQLAVERMVLSKDRGYTPEIARTPEYLDFNKKFSEVRTRIIVGDATVEEYKEVLQEWHDKFGEEYMTEMNAYIEKIESQQ